MVTASFCFAPVPYVKHVGLLALLLAAVGALLTFMSTPNMPAINSVIERKYNGKLFASAGALQNAAWSIGGFVAPLVAGALAQRSNETAFWSLSAVSMLAAAIFTYFSRVHRVALFGIRDGQIRRAQNAGRNNSAALTRSRAQSDSDDDEVALLDAAAELA